MRCVKWRRDFAQHMKRHPEKSLGVNVHARARLNMDVCENGGLASLGACLGRAGQCYREKWDQEGAKRKLEV